MTVEKSSMLCSQTACLLDRKHHPRSGKPDDTMCSPKTVKGVETQIKDIFVFEHLSKKCLPTMKMLAHCLNSLCSTTVDRAHQRTNVPVCLIFFPSDRAVKLFLIQSPPPEQCKLTSQPYTTHVPSTGQQWNVQA